MITPLCQRWRRHCASYRPVGGPIDPRRYEVAEIAEDGPCRAFIEAHPYSGSYPAARFRFGLYEGAALCGVAVFSHPCNDAVLTSVFPVPATDSTELGRLVLLDQVPANGESWFVARCFELLRGRLVGVLSTSDPEPRTTAAGETVFRGHIGTIYQAHNAVYLGRTKRRTLRLLPDGQVLHDRAVSKIRGRERGWRYAVEQLVQAGAPPLRAQQDPAAWLDEVLPLVTRPLRHGGNHKYAWGLDKAVRRHLPPSLPYPKWDGRGVVA